MQYDAVYSTLIDDVAQALCDLLAQRQEQAATLADVAGAMREAREHAEGGCMMGTQSEISRRAACYPELLEALKQVLPWAEAHYPFTRRHAGCMTAINDAKRAIALAEEAQS